MNGDVLKFNGVLSVLFSSFVCFTNSRFFRRWKARVIFRSWFINVVNIVSYFCVSVPTLFLMLSATCSIGNVVQLNFWRKLRLLFIRLAGIFCFIFSFCRASRIVRDYRCMNVCVWRKVLFNFFDLYNEGSRSTCCDIILWLNWHEPQVGHGEFFWHCAKFAREA